MPTGPGTPEQLSQDLVLAMRQLEPLLRAMLALLQDKNRAAETKIDALTDVMERIAAGLEATTTHLAPLGPRMQAQETALTHLSGQVAELGQRLDRQDHGRAALDEKIAELLAVLTD